MSGQVLHHRQRHLAPQLHVQHAHVDVDAGFQDLVNARDRIGQHHRGRAGGFGDPLQVLGDKKLVFDDEDRQPGEGWFVAVH